jgi:cell division protein FtsQ
MRAVSSIIAVLSRFGAGQRRLVLPRVLRRPFRILSRVEWRPPRHAEMKLGALLLILTGIGGVVMGGHVESVLAYATASAGLTISEVRITGQTDTSEIDVVGKLDIADGTSLATFDVAAARERVETLPWVERAVVTKLYPSTLQVAISEKTAYAIWSRGEETFLIDRDGAVITNVVDARHASLPMVAGEGAAKHASEVLAMVAAEPMLEKKFDAAVLVAERRWNILLEGGIEILLPEDDPAEALAKVAVFDTLSGLLSRDIKGVDLRDPKRLVIRLTDEGLAQRQAILKKTGGKAGGAT